MAKIRFYFEEKLNFDLIKKTFKSSFEQDIKEEYWNWRFNNNPHDSKIYIGYILEKGNLASYYAVSPTWIEVRDGRYKIALSNMTMTHPEYQGRGYFSLLAEELYQILREDDFIGVYGFQNSNSHYGFKKHLNWNDIAILNLMVLDRERINPRAVRNYNSFSFTEKLFEEGDLKILEGFLFTEKPVHIARDIETLRWRLIEIPTNTYHSLIISYGNSVSGVLIYKHYNNKDVDVMEYFYKNESSRFEIFCAGLYYLWNATQGDIYIWSNLHSDEHLYLEKMGFAESNFNTYFGIRLFNLNDKVLDIKNWHYRFMDSDVF